MGRTPSQRDDALLKSLQSNLPVIRKAAKLSQTDLASTLGISRQTVNNWENGKTFLNPLQGLAILAIVQSFEKIHPELGKVVGAVLEKSSDASSVPAIPSNSRLEAHIMNYVARLWEDDVDNSCLVDFRTGRCYYVAIDTYAAGFDVFLPLATRQRLVKRVDKQ